ncbi:uracil-DNA glycosylase [Microbaculum marinisediminis]|uniref:uracil-DNA glycosylase n=1 Tax=Microbaculum marinisediminis TaxID=2931392 RepID=UPI003CC65B1E
MTSSPDRLPTPSPNLLSEPPRDCRACPRLADFRARNRADHPDFFNAPVPSFGPANASVLVVGLAPGLKGANKTGRPFTGDYAGDLLYETLSEFGFARGHYRADPDDGLTLVDCRITNAVRCVPPQNKPVGAEIGNCRPFLSATIAETTGLRAIVALGRIAHESILSALGARRAAHPFAHAAQHELGRHELGRHELGGHDLGQNDPGSLALFDSYHCSRYNTNTGRLTPEMFKAVFAAVRDEIG